MQKGLHLSCGFSMDLPSNYIPWGGAISEEKQQEKFAAALEKCEHIATIVTNKDELPPEKGLFLAESDFFDDLPENAAECGQDGQVFLCR